MPGRANLRQGLEAVLRAHGVAVRELNVVLDELHSPDRQFSLQKDESMLGHFVTLLKKVAYFAVSPIRRRCRAKSLRNLILGNG